MKKNLSHFLLLLSFLSLMLLSLPSSKPIYAADEMIYDTSDHYLGGCGKTDTTTWTLEEDLSVTTFQIWYYWQSGEGPVGFTLKKDGGDFATGKLTRAQCDPYQTSWCNGDLVINKTFPKGSYVLKLDNKSQCAIPSGNGTVRLYGSKLGSDDDSSDSGDETTQSAESNDLKTDPSLVMIYDTSNHYIGACGQTDTSVWTGEEDMDVTVLQVWYTWEEGETSVPFTLTQDGKQLAKGNLTKTTECQWTWCNGNYTLNKKLLEGSEYKLKLGVARQCKDDKGNGVVRLFGPGEPLIDQSADGTDSGRQETDSQAVEDKTGKGLAIPLIAGALGISVGVASAIIIKKRSSRNP